MPKVKTYIVDSFTDQVFKGNPAGVCLLDSVLNESSMQEIAFELGLSETAFVQHIGEEKFKIRYFSPKMEIPLCGHATLASAKVLFEQEALNEICFVTIEDIRLDIKLKNDLIEMRFPLYTTEEVSEVPEATLKALGIKGFTEARFNKETNILMLTIDDSHTLRSLDPDFDKLVSSVNLYNGILITAMSEEEHYDFESRYFWPWSGTHEDPATGGTHTFLAPYWAEKLNKRSLSSFQCSKRTGHMFIDVLEKHILIKANAVRVLTGEINIKGQWVK